ARTDAADADNFASRIDVLEALQQLTNVLAQRLAVRPKLAADHLPGVFGDAVRSGQVPGGHQDRRLADDPVLAVHLLAQLGQRLQTVAGTRFSEILLRGLQGPLL